MPSPGLQVSFAVYRGALRALLGTSFTVVAALTAAWVFQHAERRSVAPFIFLLVLALIARYFGTMPAFLGTLLAAAVFAWFLYPPLGSIEIRDADARHSIEWMLIAGVVLADFIPILWQRTERRR